MIRHVRPALLAGVLTIAALLGVASTASAQSTSGAWGCKAQPLEASVLGLDLVETLGLLTANKPGTPCADDAAGVNELLGGLPLGLGLTVADAATALTPDAGEARDQVARAATEVAGVRLTPLNIVSLLSVGVASASAEGRCVDGAPRLTGVSDVGDVRLGGTLIDVDEPVTVVGNILNGLPLGFVAQLVPNEELRQDGRLIRRALRVSILNALGGSVLEAVVAEAQVSAADVECALPAPTVVLVDSGVNRQVAAAVAPAPGREIASCAFDVVLPGEGGGTVETVPGVYDAESGRCTATLPRATFPPGTYEVTARATDDAGATGEATGGVTIAVPQVGTPTAGDRELAAPVTPAPGTTIASCSFTVTPDGGSAVDVPGTYDAGAGVCRATVPDGVPAGPATIDATATDDNGDTGTASAAGTIGPVPTGPTVALLDSGANRVVTADVTRGTAAAPDSCVVEVRPAGSGGPYATVPATLSDGRCTAQLPREQFPIGTYEVKVSATDAGNRTGTATGTVVVAAPGVGTPTVDERVITAPVTPAPGTTITTCEITLTPEGGGEPVVFGGAVADGVCSASAPAGVTAGPYAIGVEVTDENGDTGTSSGSGTLGPDGGSQPPTIELVPGQPNRVVAGDVDVAPGRSVAECFAVAAPAVGGEPVVLPVAYDAEAGQCVAELPPGTLEPGEYTVTMVVVDSEGETAQATGPVTIATPEVGDPVVDGREVTVPVTPAPGAGITTCTITVSWPGGGPLVLTGTYDAAAGVCRAKLPDTVPAGPVQLEAEATDVNGDTGRGSGSATAGALPTPPAQPAPPVTGTGGGRPAPDFARDDAATLLVGCATGRVVLTDVSAQPAGVRLVGAADRALIGRTVDLVLVSTQRKVASAVVRADGTFAATAPLPSRAQRRSNATRYQAVVGREFSRRLKLTRRLVLTTLQRSGSRVAVAGRVVGARPAAGTQVSIQRLVGCGRYETVRRVRLDSRGRFRTTVAAPAAVAAIYRAATLVPKRTGGPASSRTFTLPAPITLTP